MNKWKQMIMDNMFLRNACSDLFGRYSFTKERGNFEPYIQYKIGHQQKDWFLYFQKLPYPQEYQNAFIKAISEIDIPEIAAFLNFHFKLYPDKQEFLSWVKLTLIASLSKVKTFITKHAIVKGIVWTQQQKDLLQFEEALKIEVIRLLEPAYDDSVDILETEAWQIAEQISSSVQSRLIDKASKLSLL